MSPQTIWKTALGELQLQMTKATYNTWLKDARLLSSDQNEYVIGVRNGYAQEWLDNRLRNTIMRTLSAITKEAVTLKFVVYSDNTMPASPPILKNGFGSPKAVETKAYGEDTADTPTLYSHFTFNTFVVGTSNRLAHAAAMSVAENPGQTYNPLFIYGGVGLGKTHLLHAIGNQSYQNGCIVRYISLETFTNDLVQSIRNKQMAEFRERYRTPDVLLIDDIQFIAGKESTQEELFHTFNELHSQGKQVVLSSDRPPKAMVTLEERLQSRFEWGLMADIQLPNLEIRKAILQAKAESAQVDVPDPVLEFIANHVRNNIRELEGALNKVIAYAQLSQQTINMELANMALSDLIRTPEMVTVLQVIRAVCHYYGVTAEAMASKKRTRTIAMPRQVVMYLARTETKSSLSQIGTYLGHRDHTTILYGYEKIASLLETDAAVRRDILEIKAALYQ